MSSITHRNQPFSEFEFASDFFPEDVAFTIYNCSSYYDVCTRRNITEKGSLTVYSSKLKNVFRFDDRFLAYSIVSFIEDKVGFLSPYKRIQSSSLNSS